MVAIYCAICAGEGVVEVWIFKLFKWQVKYASKKIFIKTSDNTLVEAGRLLKVGFLMASAKIKLRCLVRGSHHRDKTDIGKDRIYWFGQ